MKNSEKAEAAEKASAPVFSKSSILKSKRFAHRRDAVKVLLKDEESYTMEQVEKILEDFYNETERVN